MKSLQTNSIKMLDPATKKWMPKIIKKPLPPVEGQTKAKHRYVESEVFRTFWLKGGLDARYKGTVQVDASDKRPVTLPNGGREVATNLVVGEFDILALGLFAFRERWDFAFVLNSDLPRTKHKRFKPENRQYLLMGSISVEWPLSPAHKQEPFSLMDQIIKERQPRKS